MHTYQKKDLPLDTMITDFIKNGPFPALAVGIVKDNQVYFTGEYGTANLTTGDPAVRSMLFHQASVSKTFVATAVMQLVECGKVKLDSPITTYLSYFQMEDKRYQDITVRQLLNHTSGMPDEEDYAWDRPEYDEQSLERYVKNIRRYKLLSEPGTCFAYSNIGYEILGDLIAKVSGMSFEQLYENQYFYTVRDAIQFHGPSSTLYTNVEEMCQYMLMHLNQGRAKDGFNALQPGTYDEMWKPHAATAYGQENSQIGLGWFLGEYKGRRILSHSGWDTGFLSDLILLPDDNIAISVMTNCDYVWLGSVTYPILDQILGMDIRHIKQSMAHKVASIAVSQGAEQAMKEYHRITGMEQDKYYAVDFEFMRITEALRWHGHEDDAFRILTCAAAIFPESESISGRLQEMGTMGRNNECN
ncbi:serine hydrolase domain-containing protein [Paenibacillus pinihumi]|uniref:serine hydrolase domain-containing protein n=1 Tax=Paenibacillus pinihumi TaxID=669462 RepID=UPI00041D65E8|nr:serine hydrolase domain-containing protein [Paenibacillus pinihumi]